jgi:Lar family restriction alleviation protein
VPEGLGVIGDLKPCPFCGGRARLSAFGEGVNIWAAVCVGRGCKCYSPVLNSRAEAIEKWNRRASGEAAEKALEELKCIASEIAELLPEMLEFVMSFGACEKSHTCLECLYPVDCLRAEIEQAIQKWSSEMEGFR